MRAARFVLAWVVSRLSNPNITYTRIVVHVRACVLECAQVSAQVKVQNESKNFGMSDQRDATFARTLLTTLVVAAVVIVYTIESSGFKKLVRIVAIVSLVTGSVDD